MKPSEKWLETNSHDMDTWMMTKMTRISGQLDKGTIYQIRVEGRLDQKWSDWFGGFSLRLDGEQSLLTGSVPDQAALFGLLGRIRDLNLKLVSVQRLNCDCDGT